VNGPATYAACLTPPGSGAIATIAVSGPDAIPIVSQLFHANQPLAPETSTIRFGKFGEQTFDEVVVRVRRTDPVPCVELHCHGGREVVRMILETLRQHGVSVVPWQEWESLSHSNSLQREAARLLAQAQTVRTAALLLDQYQGAFDRACNSASGEQLEELARWIPVGYHLVEPWEVVVAGPVNAGKSSLVNAIAGFQRSIVSPIPGTTRDVVRVRIALDGWPVELIDTAGLRDQAGSLESQGIRLAEDAIAGADLCLWLVDGADPNPVLPSAASRSASPSLTVINKIDLPAGWDHAQLPGAVRVSARTGEGLSELCQAIAGRLVPAVPPPGAGVPFTPFLCRQVEEARNGWHAGNIADARHILHTLSARSPSSEPTN
jgi:tRNA modification GTPase